MTWTQSLEWVFSISSITVCQCLSQGGSVRESFNCHTVLTHGIDGQYQAKARQKLELALWCGRDTHTHLYPCPHSCQLESWTADVRLRPHSESQNHQEAHSDAKAKRLLLLFNESTALTQALCPFVVAGGRTLRKPQGVELTEQCKRSV